MARGRHLTAEAIQELRQLRAGGASIREIKKRTGVGGSAISEHTKDLKMNYVTVKKEIVISSEAEAIPEKPLEMVRKKHLTAHGIERLKQLRSEGITAKEIAKQFDISMATVFRHTTSGQGAVWKKKDHPLSKPFKSQSEVNSERVEPAYND